MEEIIELALEKLALLGYEDCKQDELSYYYESANEEILNILGTLEVPTELDIVFAQMIAGKYLQDKLLQDGSFGNVTSIKEGDISLSYEGGSSLTDIAFKMAQPKPEVFGKFRRITW